MPRFKVGDYIEHYQYGRGKILGNYHKRGGRWFWHVSYVNGTFGYNTENSMRLVKSAAEMEADSNGKV